MIITVLGSQSLPIMSVCPPLFQVNPITEGGLVISLRAETEPEEKLLRFLPIELRDYLTPLAASRCTLTSIRQELNKSQAGSVWAVYQIHSHTGDNVGHCYEMAAEIIRVVSKVYDSYLRDMPLTS